MIRGCECGWSGVPHGDRATLRSPVSAIICPACRGVFERVEVPARNAPCPCGSGVKFKKCHGKG